MSLINQVLRDLDRREAGVPALPSSVRAAPAPRRDRLARAATLAALAAGVAASALAWSWRDGAAAAAAPVAVADAATAPRDDAPKPAADAPRPEPATPAPPAEPARVARAADTLPKPSAVDAAPRAPEPAMRPLPPPPAAAAAVAEPPPAPARIEKRAPLRTPRQRAEAELQRGVAAHREGRLAEASDAYAAAVREDPAWGAPREALASILAAQGRVDDAVRTLAESLASTPAQPALALLLARLHAERGEWARAADVLDAAPALSADAETHALRAAILQRAGRHAAAADGFAAALRTSPQQGVWWMGLGISLAADGRRDLAREAFGRARTSGTLSPELARYVDARLRELL